MLCTSIDNYQTVLSLKYNYGLRHSPALVMNNLWYVIPRDLWLIGKTVGSLKFIWDYLPELSSDLSPNISPNVCVTARMWVEMMLLNSLATRLADIFIH